MSLKSTPSVGKSLISRIFAVSEVTSMTEKDLTRWSFLTQHEKPLPSSGENAVDEMAEIGNDHVRVSGRRPPSRRKMDAAHASALSARNVGDRVVANVGGVTRLGAELRQRLSEDLRVGLAIADLVGIGGDREMAEEIV